MANLTKEQRRQKYLANRERILSQQKKYRKNNKAKISAHGAAKYKANPKAVKERVKSWRATNRERKNAVEKKRRDRDRVRYNVQQREREAINRAKGWKRPINSAKNRARVKAWQAANPNRRHAQRQRYYHKAVTAHGYATADQIAARIEFFGGVCSYCSGPFEHLEHAIPFARNGTNWPANLRPACRSCNLSKGTKTAMEFIAWRRARQAMVDGGVSDSAIVRHHEQHHHGACRM